MCAKKTATTKPSTGNKLHQQQQQQQPANSGSSSSSNLNKNRDKKLIKSNAMVDNKNDLKQQQQQQQLSSTGLLVVNKKKTNSMNNLTPVAPTTATTTTVPLTTTTSSSATPNVSISDKIATVKSKTSTGTTITATSSTSTSKTMKKFKSIGEVGISDGGGTANVVVAVAVGGKINDNNSSKQEKTNDAKTNTIDHDKSSGNNKLNRMNDHKTNSKRDEIKSKANNKNKLVDNGEKLLSEKSNEKSVVAVNDVKIVTTSMASDNDTTAKGTAMTTKSNASVSKKQANKVKTKVDKMLDNQKKCVKPKAVKIIKKVTKGKDCKTTIKISNELKNLGVNMAKSASAISSCDETMPNEVKTSICEMVKTKTRICVTPQSTISSKSQSTLLQDLVKTKLDVKLMNKESQDKKTKSSDAKFKSTKKATSLEIATVANQQKADADISARAKKEIKPKESKLKKEKSNLTEKAIESTAVKNIQSSTSINMELEENKKDLPSDASATPKKKYVKKQKDLIIDKQIDTNNTPMAPASSAASTPVKRKYVKKKKPGDESEKTSADNSSVESSKKKKIVQSNTIEPKNGQKKINPPKESKVKKAKIVQKDEPPPSSAIKPLNTKTGFEVEYSLEKPKSDELLKTEPSDKETKITVKDINSLLEQKTLKQSEILIKDEKNACVVISMEKDKESTTTTATTKTTALAVILPAIATKIKRKYIRKNLPTSSQPIIKKSSKKQSELPVADAAAKLKPELKTSNEIKLENKTKPSGNVSDLKAPGNIIVNTEIESQKNPNLTKSDIKEKLMEVPVKVEQQQKKETTDKSSSDLQSKKNFIGKFKSDDEFAKDTITKAARADETTTSTTTSSNKKPPPPIKINKKTKSDKDPLKVDTSDCVDSTDNSDSEDDYSGASFVKPRKPPVRGNLRARKVKQFGPKRTRVASLNAIAKVHCLYENEARSALETNIHNAEQMAIAAQKQKCGYGSTTDDDEDDANVNSDKDMQAVIPR